uniref:Ubiquitin hydrolase n=1 Tax=Tanacetum cinerariifolium TaxID=118510 RepID=A0A6L2P5C2_TANCI|nr:ubiquitin hydrolase [Tanacetum cinerariifolium]
MRVLDIMLFPPAQVYSPPKKDMSWTGLPKFANDTITDYSRHSPSIEINTSDLQNSNSSVFEHGESSESIMSKTIIKFVKAGLSQVKARLVEFKTQEIKLCKKIKGLEFDVKVKNNKIKNLMNELEQVKKEKEDLDSKLTGYESASKDLDTLLGSHRTDKNNKGLRYNVVPPAQVYSPPKKDMSWTGLPEFADDTITDYRRHSPSIEINTSDLQNSNSSVFEHGESSKSIMSKTMIKFVKAGDSPKIIKTHKVETARKSFVRYAKMYRNTSKSPNVKGNQRNWNNLKSQQLGKDFLMKNKACFKCGHFDHLAFDCGVLVEKGKTWPKNNFAHKNVTSRADLLKIGRTPIAVNRTNMNVAQPKRTSFAKTAHHNFHNYSDDPAG